MVPDVPVISRPIATTTRSAKLVRCHLIARILCMCCSTQLVSFLLPSQRDQCSFQARSFLSLPLGGWGDRVRLARVQGRAAAVAILTRPTLGALVSPRQPTDCFAIVYPGRAFSQVAMASNINDPSKLAVFLP